MRRLLTFLISFIILLAPSLTLGEGGKCIEGDCVNGQGIFIYPDGNKYEGQWKDSFPNGQGTFTTDVLKYEGEFKDGIYDGQGTLTYHDGEEFRGYWRDGEFGEPRDETSEIKPLGEIKTETSKIKPPEETKAGKNEIKLLGESDVKTLITRLNKQGIIVGFGMHGPKDEVDFDSMSGDGSFYIVATPISWTFYKVDINNDNKDEYLLVSQQGSGGYFSIEAIYQERNGNLTDIFDEIRPAMDKLTQVTQASGFMNGSINIEKINGKVYFTMHQIARDYYSPDDNRPFESMFHQPEFWKLLWSDGQLKLIDSKVNAQ